ncbi:unnamed protein product, partial [Chrysoparadoxa australica]
RKQAEHYLASVEKQPSYAQQLIRLIESHCAGVTPEDKTLRTLAAVLFKNLVKKYWVVNEDGDGKDFVLPDADKEAIKGNMVHMMCIVPAEVQRQFSEALAIISKHDFPARWPSLMPDLVSKMTSTDYNVILGVLLTANSILKRFRYVMKSDALYLELKYVLEQMQAPLLDLFIRTSGAVEQAKNNGPQLTLILEALRLISRVFFSLNWQDLPEFFEDHIAQYMGEFLKYMSYENPLLVDASEETASGPIDRLQAAIVENISLYATKYEEEFQPHLAGFTQAIWALIMKTGTEPKHDVLATTCIRFLSSLVSKRYHFELFNSEATLRQILEKIVLPNLQIRPSDEELFEDNATDYIQRDLEGSDSDTRRRVSCDLVKGMCAHHEETTTRLSSELIAAMLTRYASSPDTEWRCKDSAIHMLIALAVKGQSMSQGVSSVNPFVNVMELFGQHVLPELMDHAQVNTRPVVRADCIKFISTFRGQFSVEQLKSLMPLLIAHLNSESVVVQTYAAVALERIQMVRDPTPTGQRPVQRFGRKELEPFLQPLFTGLFKALDSSEMEENEYVMRAVMRCLSTAQESVLPVAPIVLQKQTEYLARACKNPANPRFNHYLFESIAVLVSKVCQTDKSTIDQFEAALFPPFQEVLAQDVVEFAPYVFQILAQLLELQPGAFSASYEALFPPLLMPALWERKGNVPALVRLMTAYLKKDAPSLVAKGHLAPILGVFQKLLATKATEVQAFSMLCSVVAHVPLESLQQYVGDLLNMILIRLQSNKTSRYIRAFVHFCSVFAGKLGVAAFSQSLEKCQPGLLTMLVQQIWLPCFEAGIVTTGSESKDFTVGMTKLLCESLVLLGDPGMWGSFLAAVMKLLDGSSAGADAGAGEEVEVQFDSTFSRLQFATTGSSDVFPEVESARKFLATELG